MKTILGIDEAGRGSVIGPLVIAGVMIDEKDEKKLKKIHVKDSKLLTPKQREDLEVKIKKIAKDFVILKISAQEIDEKRERKNLNLIEAEKMAEIIGAMKADTAIVDAPQISTGKFKDVLIALIDANQTCRTKSIGANRTCRINSIDAKQTCCTDIISENKADVNYPVVSAASILAKVERDREIEKIKKQVGFDFGVGYPHDERTINFLQKTIDNNLNMDFIRKSWVTTQEIIEIKMQKKLLDY